MKWIEILARMEINFDAITNLLSNSTTFGILLRLNEIEYFWEKIGILNIFDLRRVHLFEAYDNEKEFETIEDEFFYELRTKYSLLDTE